MVSALLEMKVQLDTVLNQSFQKNEQFSNALKEAFEKFINQRQNKYALSIFLYACFHGMAALHSCIAWHGCIA